MSLVETESLVLKTYNLAEADRIVLFLTHDHGLVRGVAKGAKRLKSKFGGVLEPFSIVNLTYFQKDAVELVSIQNIELLRSYFSMAVKPAFLQKFSYLSDLLTAFTPPHDPNEDLYRMFLASLNASTEKPDNLDAIGFYFELWLLRLGGYLPDWSKCGVCKREFLDSESTNLQTSFHLTCSDCTRVRSGSTVTARQREIFDLAQKISPVRFADFASNDAIEIIELSSILRNLISHAIGREVNVERSLGLGT